MIKALFRWIFSLVLKILDFVLSSILSLLPFDVVSNFTNVISNVSTSINHFYGYCMKYFILVRSFLDISSFEMNLIVELLTISLLYKPIVIVIKSIVKWWHNLK